jgi:D-beta-D-heptose 7-phosphate kinase/D-beta-D-heptose 1-phosphate adenosyltransferase
VLVVGDIMFDRFVWGEVSRISPEAPVPVVRVERETESLGGAANVAANLRSLGAATSIVGVVGCDDAADRVRAVLEQLGIDDRLVNDSTRATTVKTRIMARAQQVVRVDREDDSAVDAADAERLRQSICDALPSVDAVVVSDYDKGALGRNLLGQVLPEAAKLGIPVVIDPKLRNFWAYQPATVVTPNQDEAGRATAAEVRTDDDCVIAAETILERLETAAVLVTRGPRGMLLLERGAEPLLIPAAAREVYDVTGAGDTVSAVLALALACGSSLADGARLANLGAARVVARVGTARVTLEELRAELESAG